MDYDDIIVGGGSAGAVLAARLSEDGNRNVLLIEAGPDYRGIEHTPASLLDGEHIPGDHDWGYTADMVPGRSVPYPRGKVIGGCSSVNACLALRGAPADYDEWAALGNTEWGWDKMLPYFIRIENDQDVHDDWHSQEGPTQLRRHAPSELCPTQHAFVEACQVLGFPSTNDHNHPETTGFGFGPWNMNADHVRLSTALTYLTTARGRPNLTIRPGCLVDRVVLDGHRAIGVLLLGGETISGRRVTLCGGAIGSPAILLRSGIGPVDDLRALGITPTVDLPGVGDNLIDHCGVTLSWNAAPGMVTGATPTFQTVVRYTAAGSDLQNDMQIIPFQIAIEPTMRIRTLLMKPFSQGRLSLHSADPAEQPDIQLNLASHPEDIRRLRDGMRLLASFAHTAACTATGSGIVTLDDGARMPLAELDVLLEQDAWIETYIQRTVRHYVHPVGTARMGAVVDQYGLVHGIEGLRVADASIMPTIPRANTNLACIVIGERVAGWMRAETA